MHATNTQNIESQQEPEKQTTKVSKQQNCALICQPSHIGKMLSKHIDFV